MNNPLEHTDDLCTKAYGVGACQAHALIWGQLVRRQCMHLP